ncbi:MAG: T9SS type A sorting domain-containing protein [Saprospiraceae bacterium]|nr:T9SS type A sorting domain-containing protein [Saprospiraceae bacterium]
MQKVFFSVLLSFLSISVLAGQCTIQITGNDITCFGALDGEIEINFLNAAPPFEVEIQGQTFFTSDLVFTVPGYPVGIYQVNVTDANNCMVSELVTLNEPTPLMVLDEFITVCAGQGDCIQLTIFGGVPPYSINWNGIVTNNPLICDFPFPGTFEVEVIDANDCTAIALITVEEVFTDVFIIEDPISCSESLLSAVVNGIPGFAYNWSTGETSQSITVTSPGVYSVTVFDQFGCEGIATFVYDQELQVTTSFTDISCNGSNDGSIDTDVNGVGSFTYEWTFNGQVISTAPSIFDLEPGVYELLVTQDNSNCEYQETFVLNSPDQLEITTSAVSASCNGGSDGEIVVTVTGGTAPYTYDWNNGSFGTLVNVPAGLYSVTVTDANGCTVTEETLVTEPEPLIVDITATAESCLGDGSASAQVSGGTPGYTFEWSNGETGDSLTNLVAGTYSLTVTDANGCFATASTDIDSPISISTTSTETSCNTANGTATVEVLSGANEPVYLWSTGATTPTIDGLEPGGYSVTVTDLETECQVHQNIYVLEDSICYVKIEGYVFVDDVTPDCQVDGESEPAKNVLVELSDGQITFTDENGYYVFYPDAGTYDLSISFNENVFDGICIDPITVDATTWGECYSGNDFFLAYGEDLDIELKVNKPNARPGFFQWVTICLMNRGAHPVSGTLSYIHPEAQELDYCAPEHTSYDEATRTVTWDYVDIPPNTTWVYHPVMYTPVDVALGTELLYEFSAPVNNDLTPWNNEIICTEEVTGSFDPNDKAVEPVGEGPEGFIAESDTSLSYKIRFQNTGTDTAFTVRIVDTLDTDLDLKTLQLGPASHAYTAKVENNILEFLFENILLPDSIVNEPESHGFVYYDIDFTSGSGPGTEVTNRAGIYFDFNEPVITNEVVSTIMEPNFIYGPLEQVQLELFPNPVMEKSQLSFSLEATEDLSVSILSLEGKTLVHSFASGIFPSGKNSVTIPVSKIPSGLYFVQLKTKSGKEGILKLIKP